jgi:serine/threonine protein kinase
MWPDSLAVGEIDKMVHILGSISRGSHGFVCKAQSILNNETFALKAIQKKQGNESDRLKTAVDREIELQSQASGSGVVKIFKSFEDSSNYYLVLEHCGQGELFKYFPFE